MSSDFEKIGRSVCTTSDRSDYEANQEVLDNFATRDLTLRRDAPISYQKEYSEFAQSSTLPLKDNSTQTDDKFARVSDRDSASSVPKQSLGTFPSTVVPWNNALAVILVAIIVVVLYFLVDRGNYYYVRLEIGGFGLS